MKNNQSSKTSTRKKSISAARATDNKKQTEQEAAIKLSSRKSIRNTSKQQPGLNQEATVQSDLEPGIH